MNIVYVRIYFIYLSKTQKNGDIINCIFFIRKTLHVLHVMNILT
jgi:hypothetical protein